MRRFGWFGSILIAGLAVLAGTAAASLVPRGRIHYVDVPTVQLSLRPLTVPGRSGDASGIAMLAAREPAREIGLPAPVDPALVEKAAVGTLPRIAADGRTSLQQYAHPSAPGCDRPCIGLIITGLGLATELTTRALALPAFVGLSFSPYADAAGWQARARRQGHEVLLDLPLQPARYPQDDSGPLTLAPSPAGLQPALMRALAAGSGYVALTADAGAFAGDTQAFAPLARMLHERGLGFVELGGSALSQPARAEHLAYVTANGPIAPDSTEEASDHALAGIEAAALQGGAALVFARPTPLGLDRLTAWLETLPAKGLLLAPPSRLLERAGSPQTLAGE